jgi:alpha-1,2-mannosyltransferase
VCAKDNVCGSGRQSLIYWGALGCSIAAYAAVTIAERHPFCVGPRPLNYFDLKIYRGAAARVWQDAPLYGTPIKDHLGFTYPPFAALVLTPLAWLPQVAGEITVTAINVALLVLILRLTLSIAVATGQRSSPSSQRPAALPDLDRHVMWPLAAAAAAAALWLEPVSVTLGYGQINLLIDALVIFDISRPDRCRAKGIATGLATAIKLTPLMFLAYLLLSRRYRAALRAAGTFLATIACSFLVIPSDAAHYWGVAFFHSARIGRAADIANQSLPGAFARIGHGVNTSAAGYLTLIAIVAGGLALAVHLSRQGDEAAGFSLAAASSLLASPISWTHHWTILVPALLLLGMRAYAQRSRWLATATGAALLLGYGYAPEHLGMGKHLLRPGLTTIITGNPYVLAAVIAITATAAVTLAREIRSGRERTS